MRTSFGGLAWIPLLLAGACTGGGAMTGATSTSGGMTAPSSASTGDASAGAETQGGTDSSTGGATDASTSTETGSTGNTEGGEDVIDLPELATVDDGHFATSLVCAECHANHPDALAMRDEQSRPIAPDDLWQGSMMANSARDPFWWAMVAAETATFPANKAEIEAECMPCHAPMAVVDGVFHDAGSPSLDWLRGDDDRASFGLDGVACAACHQIQPDKLGTEASFSGGYVIEPVAEIYGPHAEPFSMPMMMHTSFTPTQGDQLLDSALCGSCHTLRTAALDPDGTPNGHSLVEQSPYLEWRLSDFTTEGQPGPSAASCQDCHTPKASVDGVPISAKIARRPNGTDFPPISDRDPYGRHVMVGGNSIIPLVIRDNAAELHPRASDAALEATAAAAKAQLQERTATLSAEASRDGDTLIVDVTIDNLAGHRLPSAFPSRRAWIALRVFDSDGTLVFRSGDSDGDGRLIDGSGQPLPSEAVGGPIQPHFTEIDASSQAQIYESVMATGDDAPAFRLLQGTRFIKDNRLLPKGWKGDAPEAQDIAPVGIEGDPNFTGGGDQTRYRIAAPAAAGPYTVTAELCYQTLSARFAAELFAVDAAEVRAFERMFKAADRTPVIVDSESLQAD